MSYQDYYLPFNYGPIKRGTHIDFIPTKTLQHIQEQEWINQWDGLEEAIDEQLAMRDRSDAHF